MIEEKVPEKRWSQISESTQRDWRKACKIQTIRPTYRWSQNTLLFSFPYRKVYKVQAHTFYLTLKMRFDLYFRLYVKSSHSLVSHIFFILFLSNSHSESKFSWINSASGVLFNQLEWNHEHGLTFFSYSLENHSTCASHYSIFKAY